MISLVCDVPCGFMDLILCWGVWATPCTVHFKQLIVLPLIWRRLQTGWPGFWKIFLSGSDKSVFQQKQFLPVVPSGKWFTWENKEIRFGWGAALAQRRTLRKVHFGNECLILLSQGFIAVAFCFSSLSHGADLPENDNSWRAGRVLWLTTSCCGWPQKCRGILVGHSVGLPACTALTCTRYWLAGSRLPRCK